MPRYDNNNRNRMTYHEYRLGYIPKTNEEREAANREIDLLNEIEDIAFGARMYEENVLAAEQKGALKRMLLPGPLGSTLKEELLAHGVSSEKINKALQKKGLTRNTATTEQLFNTIDEVYQGGPVVEGVGTGPKPSRRYNRAVRRQSPVLTMKKHLRPRNIKKGAITNLGPNVQRYYQNQARIQELESQLQGLNRRGGRRKTRRTRRRN